jgi:hypothetical protein
MRPLPERCLNHPRELPFGGESTLTDETMQPQKHPKTYSAQDARGAEIILRTRGERRIFLAGLVAAMAVGVVAVIMETWLHS